MSSKEKTGRQHYEPTDGFAPIEPLPSIREVCAMTHVLHRKTATKAELEAEDLNDKKCAWMQGASSVPARHLTARELMFLRRYQAEGLHFSTHWNLKPAITDMLRDKKREFAARVKDEE